MKFLSTALGQIMADFFRRFCLARCRTNRKPKLKITAALLNHQQFSLYPNEFFFSSHFTLLCWDDLLDPIQQVIRLDRRRVAESVDKKQDGEDMSPSATNLRNVLLIHTD